MIDSGYTHFDTRTLNVGVSPIYNYRKCHSHLNKIAINFNGYTGRYRFI